jgi:pimeloyl-ACP methyl ester carboxylesterase/DNA-binding SARP family transcriptional activator
VRYARAAGLNLAYQTWGTGPAVVVAIPPMAQNIELMWERPEYRHMLDRLGSFARVLHFDKRGTGASDRTATMPTMDERVEDVRIVMDAAGVDVAHLLGVSEGGPAALVFAATYPERVAGVVLVSSGARLVDDTVVTEDERRELLELLIAGWGTQESITLDVFAPTAAADDSYRAWEPRYERQSASPAALRQVLDSIVATDVRPLLSSVDAPVLVLHRSGDPIVPLALAREAASGIPGARLVELDGVDHFAQVGDIDSWLDHVEELVAGSVQEGRPAYRPSPGVEIVTMGGFRVSADGTEVPQSAWGSRRARQLCKRLAVAAGAPVPRDVLAHQLWPDESDPAKLGARLSVLLSNIRRVLHGGLAADRDAVALDLGAVHVDLHELQDALAHGDDARAIAAYTGPVLPEDAYEDWAISVRDRVLLAVVGAHRRLAAAAASAARHDDAVSHLQAILDLDPYDERAHERLVQVLEESGRRGDSARAAETYRQRMAELGVEPQPLRS